MTKPENYEISSKDEKENIKFMLNFNNYMSRDELSADKSQMRNFIASSLKMSPERKRAISVNKQRRERLAQKILSDTDCT